MVSKLRKGKDKPAKVVWRISAAAPLGEFVDSEAERRKPAEPKVEPAPVDGSEPPSERSWHSSSHELTHGIEVTEEPLDTLPDDLFDHFVKKT